MKEKWVRINTIEGYEDIKNCYWISNSDDDVIVNRNTGKKLKIILNSKGYKKIGLRTIHNKYKYCSIHVFKAKAFIHTVNPLGANVVRHLNDVKSDNRLKNLAWGTRSDNTRDSVRNGNHSYENLIKYGTKGAIKGGITSAKKTSKPVRCIETGIIYISACEAERRTGIPNSNINYCCRGRRHTAGGFHWEFVNLISES